MTDKEQDSSQQPTGSSPKSADPSVAAFLAEVGIPQYGVQFDANDITFDILQELSEPDLTAIGVVSVGHRKRILAGLAARRLTSVPTRAPHQSASMAAIQQSSPQPIHSEPSQPVSAEAATAGSAKPPSPWRNPNRGPRAVEVLIEAGTLAELTQEIIDRDCADTDQFWKTSFDTVRRSYSPNARFALTEPDDLIRLACDSQDARAGVAFFALYPALRGEGLVSWAAGHLLTNYRLGLNLQGAMIDIPLSAVATYEDHQGFLSVRYRDGSDVRTLELRSGTYLNVPSVQAVLAAREFEGLRPSQKILLQHSTAAIEKRLPGIRVPRVAMKERPPGKNPIAKAELAKTKSEIVDSLWKLLGFGAVIGAIGLLGHVCGDSSSESTSSLGRSPRRLQNGEIPGFSACLNDPRMFAYCCDKVGGDYLPHGTSGVSSFPTCQR